jgi:hypothetical protein
MGDCDDGDLCTIDVTTCDASTNFLKQCMYTRVQCQPGFSCNPIDGSCFPDACTNEVNCNDGNACTIDSVICDLVTGQNVCDNVSGVTCPLSFTCDRNLGTCQPDCDNAIESCDDENRCTTDTVRCNTETGINECTYEPFVCPSRYFCDVTTGGCYIPD